VSLTVSKINKVEVEVLKKPTKQTKKPQNIDKQEKPLNTDIKLAYL